MLRQSVNSSRALGARTACHSQLLQQPRIKPRWSLDLPRMINEDIPGIEFSVQVNDQDLKEYDAPDAGDEDETHPTCTKYIECIDEAFFQIRFQVTHEYDWSESPYDLSLKVYIDGKCLLKKLVRRHQLYNTVSTGVHESTTRGKSGGWRHCKFQFASIKTGRSTTSNFSL